MSDPIDVARFALCTGALWLAALVLRLGWIRYRRPSPRVDRRTYKPTHPMTYVSYAGALVLIAGQRLTRLGEPLSWDFPVAVVVVLAGLYGVLKRTKLTSRPPHKRGTA